MRLLMTGCEYAGVTTLTMAIKEWAEAAMGGEIGDGHDHFKVPHLAHGELSAEEQDQVLALSPHLKEIFQRYNMEYHMQPSFFDAQHHVLIGMHIDDAVYAPIYYGYGAPGEYAARSDFARHMEERLVGFAPDFIHVLVTASPEVIAARMDENPHQNPVVPKKDIKKILSRFEEEFEASTMTNKITIDTSTATVEESLAEFIDKVAPVLNDRDRTAMLVKKAEKAGDWP